MNHDAERKLWVPTHDAQRRPCEPITTRVVPDLPKLLIIEDDGRILPHKNRLEIKEANKLFKKKVAKRKPLDF